ncbi:MAG: hypothetical protein RL757_2332, partial [Bacteroidota bacterium]
MLKSFFLVTTAVISACFVNSNTMKQPVQSVGFKASYNADHVSIRSCENGNIVVIPEGGDTKENSFYTLQVVGAKEVANQDIDNAIVSHDDKSVTVKSSSGTIVLALKGTSNATFEGFGLSYAINKDEFEKHIKSTIVGGGKIPDDVIDRICRCHAYDQKKRSCDSGGEG